MRAYLCAECLAAGVTPDEADGDDFLVSCSFCGAIDEKATYSRNTYDVHDRFGTLVDGHGIRFREAQERKLDEFVDVLLDAYLLDPTSRVTEAPSIHFKAGVKTWYNRYRKHEQARLERKAASTNREAQKVKYLLAIAIHITILESNVVVVNNRLPHLKYVESAVPAAKGDGTVMAPSLKRIFARLNSLGSSHVGYLADYNALLSHYRRFKEVRGKGPSAMEITLAQVYVIAQRVQFLLRLPHETRLQHLAFKTLTPSAVRRKTNLQNAQPADFVLGPAGWNYMGSVDWTKAFQTSYDLYCAQQVVSLWGNRCSIDISVALLQWSIMITTGAVIPNIVEWSEELSVPYGGSSRITQRRREELKDQIVGWSTSFPDAGIPVPILSPPARGSMGNGLTMYGSDKRRAIPEMTMALAAAPIVASKWRQIVQTRLQTRTAALPLDTEYTLAAKMFAKVFNDDQKAKREMKAKARAQAKAQARKAASAPGSRRGSRATSTSLPPESLAHRAVSQPPRCPPSPSIEAMLATRDDSSDEDVGRDSDDEENGSLRQDPHGGILAGQQTVPFAFSIGPKGFSVATDQLEGGSVPVRDSAQSGKHGLDDPPSGRPYKRSKRPPPVVPLSPAPTSSSRSISPADSRPSLSPAPDHYRLNSPTPSLRSITMSPSLTAISAEPVDLTHIGVLARERSQYAYYNKYNDQRSGALVSPEVQDAINAWVSNARENGTIPNKITLAYLAGLGIHGDPRTQDLGAYITAHSQWSPVECLLRLGLRPEEFPHNYVPHSLLDLQQKLGNFSWEAQLAPEGAVLDDVQLEAELDALFVGSEGWRDLIATPQQADLKERMYIKGGAWSFGRDIPEGPTGQAEKTGKALRRAQQLEKSRRIDYSVLDKLVYDSDEEVADAVQETVWGAIESEGSEDEG